ncbi:WS/DGAT domain-containing protein [Nonomuraea sp. NBC_00507]|uniref:wax ester/triacylglycerol synthase domain-containing protein n=1 Tax=Nonomuraea sp. NBC_00507 TaxID=2976002 RepID=UPI002E17D0BE
MTRLSPTDHSFLTYQAAHPGVSVEIGQILLFGGRPPSVGELRAHLAPRLDLLPALRRTPPARVALVRRPRWAGDRPIDLVRHVRERRVETGALHAAVDEVLNRPLPDDAPLWELWLLHGYDDDEFAVFYKAHHPLHDGVSLVDVAEAMFAHDPAFPHGSAAGRLPLRRVLRGLASLTAGCARIASSTPLHVPASGRRRLVWCSVPMAWLQDARRAGGSTINDVYLAALAGAVRHWSRGAIRRLQVLVPVSTRTVAERGTLGNRLAALRVLLPCEEIEAAERLSAVTQATRRAKERGEATAAAWLTQAGRLLPAAATRGLAELSLHPRLTNLMASNIPGPRGRLTLAGRPLQTIIGVNFLPRHHGASVMLMSHRDRVVVSFHGDAALPGLDDLPRLWLASLREPAGQLVDVAKR